MTRLLTQSWVTGHAEKKSDPYLQRFTTDRGFLLQNYGNPLYVCAHRTKRFIVAIKYAEEESYRYLIASDLSWQTLDIVQGHTLRWLVEICQSCNLRRTLFWQKIDSVGLQPARSAVCGAAAWRLTSWGWPPLCGYRPCRTAIPTGKPVQARDHP
jgi:hypothetical protein